MQQITFTNKNGESITLSFHPPYILESVDGTGSPESDVQMQKAPFQDGMTHIDVLLQPRPLAYEVSIVAESTDDLFVKRAELTRIINPKLGPGWIRYDYAGGTKYIQATPDPGPIFPKGADNRGPNYQKALISFICPNPYWLDEKTTTEPMVAFAGAFQFPFSFPVEFGTQGYTKTITNDGHVATPVQITFAGPATNPVVTNETTGEFILVNRNILTGESLFVDTTFGQKKVQITHANGSKSNAFNYIDLDSVFWELQPGDNEISYNAASGAETAVVTISHRNQYIGI